MTNYTTLPLEAHDTRSVFLEHAWNVGRAYRNQALELISMCQLLTRTAPPKLAHEDAELRRILRVCDLALRSAAESGTKVTSGANARFNEAARVLSGYSWGRHGLMEIAQQRDSVEGDWSHVKSEYKWEPTITVNFVLLRSPLLSPHDPETVVVSQELSASTPLPEILWNFSRYNNHARITLEQNPHFYLRIPADESAYSPKFRRYPLQDTSGALEHNDTVYVLFDRPGRVFLTTEHGLRIFGNVWSLNSSLIFRDRSGVLEGTQLVRSSNIRYNLWCREEPVVHQDSETRSRLNHSCLQPIVTIPSTDHSAEGASEDWAVLSRSASHGIDIHIYGSRGPTSGLDLPPPPPTSGRPGYDVLYATINELKGDILLGIFNYYRLDKGDVWNDRLGWLKLSHVCQRWRHLIYESAFHLDMHIICTNGTPTVDTLAHLPPLPLIVDYRYRDVTIRDQDGLGIYHALRLCDRVRHIDLRLPPSILQIFLTLMDESFPILEHLSLSSTGDVGEITTLALPKTLIAPNLRHLALTGIHVPKRLRLLSSTPSLVTLVIASIRAPGYFLPRLLLARLRSLPQLEELSIEFSVPIPRPSAERELLGERGTPVTLPNLKKLRFQGVSAYLECLVARIRVPLLERLDITLFNQIFFALPHLSHLIDTTEALKLSSAEVFFQPHYVAITMAHYSTPRSLADGPFVLRVVCRQLDWQIDCAAQICNRLIPALSVVERLGLDLYEEEMPTEWRDGEIDGTTWHELLRSFIGVEELVIGEGLSEELSRALQVNEVGSDPGLLPSLRKLVSEFERKHTDNSFGSFIHARRGSGRPIPSSVLRWVRPRPVMPVKGTLGVRDPVIDSG